MVMKEGHAKSSDIKHRFSFRLAIVPYLRNNPICVSLTGRSTEKMFFDIE